jgi:hypothetical protein
MLSTTWIGAPVLSTRSSFSRSWRATLGHTAKSSLPRNSPEDLPARRS